MDIKSRPSPVLPRLLRFFTGCAERGYKIEIKSRFRTVIVEFVVESSYNLS